jgi:hypothetical protein
VDSNILRVVSSVLIFLTIFFWQVGRQMAWAEGNLQGGGGNVQARLDFRITVPTVLYLQIGTTGASVDQITFTINDLPGTGAVEGSCSGTYPVPVRAAGFLRRGQRMTIRANSSAPLTNGSENIRFNNISWTATGNFTSGRFNNYANQRIERWTASGNRTGNLRFFYDNDEYHGPGTYKGRVTYTLSSP